VNAEVRAWIESEHQPWRQAAEESVLGGTIDAPGIRPLHEEFTSYFTDRGLSLEGRTFEEVKEIELLQTFEEVCGWLTPAERAAVDTQAAFGVAFTRLPNACAIRHGDAYAVLFDIAIDPVLIATSELWLAVSEPPVTLDAATFARAYNAAIISIFFRETPFWTPIPDDGFAHREEVNRLVWTMTVFMLAHEVGHILHGHLKASGVRHRMMPGVAGSTDSTVVAPEHAQEFEADAFAVSLITRAAGSSESGANLLWVRTYVALAMLFTVLESVEQLAERAELETDDTHPGAMDRWYRIEAVIRDHVGPATREATRQFVGLGADAAREGIVPSSSGEETDVFPAMGAVLEWIAAETPERSRQILHAHPELVSQAFDLVLGKLPATLTDPATAERVRTILHPLLRRAKAVGVDAAYEEWLEAGAPPPASPVFEVPMDLIHAASAALKAGDMDRVDRLRRENDALDRFFELRSTFNRMLATGDIHDTMNFISAHPEVMLPQADKLFDEAATVQSTDASRRKLAGLRGLVERSRAVGPVRAAYECVRFWGAEASSR
jgi:hypothetical protein